MSTLAALPTDVSETSLLFTADTSEVIVCVLSLIDDIWDWPSVALTCKRLAGVVYGVSSLLETMMYEWKT